ncbi:MAG: hypothetical protein J0H95_07225 [Xanthomonadales bacterium]|nr:hypothetical protein [Xanthomonadales bacterium]
MLKRLLALLLLATWTPLLHAQDVATWPSFKTDGHGKSNGINLTIKYPSDWTRKEGERPHIVQKFLSPDHQAYVMVVIQDLGIPAGTPITQEELEATLDPSQLKDMVPSGMQFIGAQKTKIETLPAGILEYQTTQQRAGLSIDQQVWALIFIYKTSMVQIQCGVGGQSGINTTELMGRYKPLCIQIANTIVLPDKWVEAATAASSTAPSTSVVTSLASPKQSAFAGESFAANLLLSLALTWGIGLAPPLLIRYVFARRPIGKGAAIGLCVLFWLFNFILFTALGSQSKAHTALVLVALASFAILRRGAAEKVGA